MPMPRGIAGVALRICWTFSASDMRLTRSRTRSASGCEASFQMAGPATLGIFNADVSSALIMSAARTKMTGRLSRIVLELQTN